MKSKDMLKTWKGVFKSWKYSVIVAIIAVFFYSINVLISSWSSVKEFSSSFGFFSALKFFLILFLGFKETIKFHSFVSLIIISFMLGFLFSLLVYKASIMNLKNSNKKTSFFGGIGIFLAAFAPGCAACGVGLASLLGLGTAFFTFLPYEGLELSILSILILGYVIFKTTKDMYICKIPKHSLIKLKGGKK